MYIYIYTYIYIYIYTHTYIHTQAHTYIFHILFHSSLSQDIEYSLSSQSYGFPVVMWVGPYGKAECLRVDAFKLWCWRRRLLRAPWTARKSNQSILKETDPEYSLEGLMLKLKLQYFGHLIWRTDSLEKSLMLAKIEGRRKGDNRGWGDWMASPTQWTWFWVSSRCW